MLDTINTKTNIRRIALLGAMLFIFNLPRTQAQEMLDPVTVTSSLVEKRTSETGRNITIIPGKIFEKLPVHSVDELLKYIPGIEAQMRGPQGSQTDISIRGGTFQQVLIILDGLRLKDPNTGHFTGYIPIVPAEIDRIEVLKGASAAIYGSDAVGGVINIITKAFSSKLQSESRLFSADAAIGEYGLWNVNAGGFFQNEKINIGAGIISNHASGVQQRGIKGYFHNTAISAGARIKMNDDWSIALRSAYDVRDFAAQNFYTTYASDTATEKISSLWNQMRLQYTKNKNTFTLDAGYKTLTDHYLFNKSSIANNNISDLWQAQALYQSELDEQTTIVTGFNFQQLQIKSNDRGNHSVNAAAPFINVIQKLGKNVYLMPSIRAEFFGNRNIEWVPQLTTSLKIQRVQLRASGGKTIRNADFTELYNNYNKDLVKSGTIGNPGLTAEKSWNYEVGADWFYGATLKLSGTFFQRYHSNLIDWVNTPYEHMPRKENLFPGSMYGLAKNVASVNTTGWETDLAYQATFSHKQSLNIKAGAVWLWSKSSEENPSFYILSHAKFIGNGTVIYAIGPFSLSLGGIYKLRTPQEATAIKAEITKNYFLLNGKASYSFVNNTFSVFVQGDNLFNTQYSDLLGAQMPGRWMQGGVSMRLKQ